jgi:hypothetical protein
MSHASCCNAHLGRYRSPRALASQAVLMDVPHFRSNLATINEASHVLYAWCRVLHRKVFLKLGHLMHNLHHCSELFQISWAWYRPVMPGC